MTVIRLGTLVTTNWLREQLGTVLRSSNGVLRILDTSWLPEPNYDGYNRCYKEAHIPGSKFFDLEKCSRPLKYIPYSVPDANYFTDYAQNLGISEDTHIVAYDRFNTRAAARTWWLFRLFGHNQISILDGGLNKWLENGYEVTQEEPEFKRGNFEARLNPQLMRKFDTMMDNAVSKREQVMDARGSVSFTGGKEPSPGVNPGHIPGARNIPFAQLFNEDGTFKSEKELKKLFDQAGIDLGKPVVASCLLGLTACGLSVAAHILGKEVVPVYYGSWYEFGQRVGPELCETGK